ncbi:MAG: hypothetical protein KDK38_13150 [Leptospiraceae bacterium]|nr:hypothetical protein [Leptospiraceae bacterium]
MKKITIIRGGCKEPFILENGDKYDSVIIIEDAAGKAIARIPFVNTDFTEKYKGGILAPGTYRGICARRKSGDKAIWLFRSDRKITAQNQISAAEYMLPSLIPNPNHGGKKQMQYILIHRGGLNWDWSHGCVTIIAHYFDRFAKHFEVNELCEVELIQAGE